jgi:hypothetical protein
MLVTFRSVLARSSGEANFGYLQKRQVRGTV